MTGAAIQRESANNSDGPHEPHPRQNSSYSIAAACESRTSLRFVRLSHASIIRDNFDGRPPLIAGNNDHEKNFTLAEAGEAEGMAWVDATPKSSDSGFEKVRPCFAGSDLRDMELQDSFGQTTHIRFSKFERNPTLPDNTFEFTPPPGVDVAGE